MFLVDLTDFSTTFILVYKSLVISLRNMVSAAMNQSLQHDVCWYDQSLQYDV